MLCFTFLAFKIGVDDFLEILFEPFDWLGVVGAHACILSLQCQILVFSLGMDFCLSQDELIEVTWDDARDRVVLDRDQLKVKDLLFVLEIVVDACNCESEVNAHD